MSTEPFAHNIEICFSGKRKARKISHQDQNNGYEFRERERKRREEREKERKETKTEDTHAVGNVPENALYFSQPTE